MHPSDLSKSGKCMNFGQALHYLKAGFKVSRTGWNGAGMFAYLVPASQFKDLTGKSGLANEAGLVPYRAYLALKTAQGDIATWSPSTSDCLAEDWEIVV